jgi:pyruvate-formate lyase
MAWIDRENGFRSFSAEVAIDTSSIQLESDEIMRRASPDFLFKREDT